jgi:hypothetical protein
MKNSFRLQRSIVPDSDSTVSFSHPDGSSGFGKRHHTPHTLVRRAAICSFEAMPDTDVA